MGIVRVVHTANAHLGVRFPHMDRETEAMRVDDMFRVFGELVAYVIKNKADLVLVAGDLFARVNLRRETIARVLEWFAQIHEKLPQTRFLLTPGADELFVRRDGALECTLRVLEHLPYVDIIGGDKECERHVYELNGQDVTVASCPFDMFLEPDFKPSRILPVKRGFGIFLVNAHSRRRRADSLSDDELIENTIKPLAKRGYGYCAFGHSRSLKILTADGATGAFPGSLERLSFDTDRGKKYFLTFTINDQGAMSPLEPVRTRVRPLEYVGITCSLGNDNLDAMLEDLNGRGGKDKILYIALDGQMDFESFKKLRNSSVLDTLRESYAAVHIDNRLILVDGAAGFDFNALRVGTPAEEFRRHLEREMAAVEPGSDEHKLLQELFEMGIREIEQSL